MLTKIWKEERPALKALGARRFKELSWRHNGIGVLQGYVAEGLQSTESRFHIWHPDLILPGMAEGGLYHDHRFDLVSSVLYGEIHHDELGILPDVNGEFEFALVHNARKAKSMGGHRDGEYHSDPERTGERFNLSHNPMVITADHTYSFPKAGFHGSSSPGLAITYVVKKNQENIRAKLIVPFGKEYTHAFAHVKPRAEWEHVIDEAIAALEIA